MSASLITVVVQIDACRFTSVPIPPENEPPLFVDTDRMEAFQMAPQLFEMVAGRDPQILIRHRIVDHLEFPKQAAFQFGWDSP
jgi:hypothetical protein